MPAGILGRVQCDSSTAKLLKKNFLTGWFGFFVLGCVFSRIAPLLLPICTHPIPWCLSRLCLVSHSSVALQVLHQLRRLGMVWQDVLPVNVYCKAMGALLNTALAEIVTRIAALEVITGGVLGTAFVTYKNSPQNHLSGSS